MSSPVPSPGERRPSGWPGMPRLGEVLRDAAASARAQIAASLTLVLVLATMVFAVLVTTGQAAASEAQIVAQIDSAGTRLIVLSDEGGASGMQASAPARLAGLSDVSWAAGLGPAVDVTNPALPLNRAASRALVGPLPPDLVLVQGRSPRPGEAVAGAGAAVALNLGPGLGRIQVPGADPVGVVGVFQASGPLANLNNTVLVATDPADIAQLRYIYVMAADVTVIDRLEHVITTSTPVLNPAALTVETPSGAVAFRDVIAGRLGAASRQLMAVIMIVGAIVIAVTVLAGTSTRRREFGRRRALGATRSTLVATLLIQTTIAAVPGILIGTTAGLITLHATTGLLPSWRFTTGVAGLTLLLTLAASTPIATIAAHRDPLRILRVP